jgi:hypothetical protein
MATRSRFLVPSAVKRIEKIRSGYESKRQALKARASSAKEDILKMAGSQEQFANELGSDITSLENEGKARTKQVQVKASEYISKYSEELNRARADVKFRVNGQTLSRTEYAELEKIYEL